ncbi:MAG: LVIVD repeat-containing protein [Candidatus Heimdallarchaeota archaeon]
MLSYKSYFSGLIIGIIILCNPIFLANGQTIDSDVIYLNKVAECTFEVGYRIDIEDNVAYVTDNNGVMVIDIENPRKPKKIGRIAMVDGGFGIEIRNDTAFVAGVSPSLVIANVSIPNNPVLIGQFSGTNVAYALAVQGNYCYLGYLESDLAIIEITDLTHPTLVKTITGTSCTEVIVHDEMLFICTQTSGLRIYDISDPVNPVLLKSLFVEGANGLDVKDDVLYVACHHLGIKAVDITVPASAYVIKSIAQDDDGEAQGIVCSGNFVAVADNYGVEVYNITNPTYMAKEAEYRQGVSAAHDIEAVGNFLFLAKGFGLGIFEISATKKGYFPSYLYYVLPIVVVVMGGLSLLITRRRKMRSQPSTNETKEN